MDLQVLIGPLAKCESGGMRNILFLVRSELFRSARMTGLAAVVICWVGLVISIGWPMRIVNSTRPSLMTGTPASVAEMPDFYNQPR